MIEYVEDQNEEMQKIYDETMDAHEAFEKNYKSNTNVTTAIYGASLIEKDHQNLKNKFTAFTEDLDHIQKHKYRFQVWLLLLFVILGIGGLAGFWIRRDFIPWIAFMCLMLLSVPIFVIAGLECVYGFLSVDFCAVIGNSIISGVVPSESKGLGVYFSCPSKETMRTIATAVYQFSLSYDVIYKELKSDFSQLESLQKENLALGTDKRNNTYFENLIDIVKKDSDIDSDLKSSIKFKLENLILINRIMAGLLSMNKCRTARNVINHSEEFYCAVNHKYMVLNIIMLFFAALGYIILAIGLNKLIIVMKSYFARALRGKGEFNNDIIEDDDED